MIHGIDKLEKIKNCDTTKIPLQKVVKTTNFDETKILI